MPNLGLVKTGDDPTKNFIPLLEGQYLGRTPKEILQVSNVVGSPSASSDSSPNKTSATKELDKFHQKYAPVGIVDDSKAISRKCLKVTLVSPYVIKLIRNQLNVPGKQPIHIVQVHPNLVSKSILPNETVKLRCNDVLQIHQPDPNNLRRSGYSFQVVPEPVGWRQLPPQQKKHEPKQPSRRQSNRPRAPQLDTNMKHCEVKRSKIIGEIEEEAPVVLPPSFWNPTWGGELLYDEDIADHRPETVDLTILDDNDPPADDRRETIDLTIPNDASIITTPSSSTYNNNNASSLFRDMNLATGQLYWKQLNSSNPHLGATFLHMTLQLPQQLPSFKLCQDMLQLLTWGPHTTEHLHGTIPQFFWDGPRLHHAMALLEKLLQQYPGVMVPRLSEAAPSGWWKTIMDDIISHHHNNDNKNDIPDEIIQLKKRKVEVKRNDDNSVICWNDDIPVEPPLRKTSIIRPVVETLRMQSCSLQTLLSFLQACCDYEQHGHFQQTPCPSESDSDDDKTVDESINDAPPIDGPLVQPTLRILQELRSYGGKAVLQTIANTLAHVWIAERSYLGGSYNTTTVPLHEVSWWNAHCDVAETIVSQLSKFFSLAWKIVSRDATTDLTTIGKSSPYHLRRPRGYHQSSNGSLSDDDVRQILSNAMDMQIRTNNNLDTDDKPKTPAKKQATSKRREGRDRIVTTTTDMIWIGWIRHLEGAMGHDFACKLAQQHGIADQYQRFLNRNDMRKKGSCAKI
jgi:hypothetical protein